MDDKAKDLAEKFWDLGNYVTGFAALQMVGLVFALKDADAELRIARVWHFLVPACFVVGLAMADSVWSLWRSEKRLRVAAKESEVVVREARRAATGRIMAILAMYSAGCAVMVVASTLSPSIVAALRADAGIP
jgi:hypothetical protein